MADRGRVGGLIVASRSCAKKIWRAEHEQHRRRIKQVKPSTDMTEPGSYSLESVRNNLKKERLLEDRYMEIDRENQVLLNKMQDLMKKPSLYSAGSNSSLPATLNQQGRKKELMAITQENKRMLKAIQGVEPVYDRTKWEKSYAHSDYLLRNCCHYPVVTRMSRNQSAPSRLVPLHPEDRLQQGVVPAEMDPGGPVVFKDGKRMGDAYYLIEMSTDGKTLTVSAYDGDSQKSLELVIKEKRHRQIHRECNGDYSQLAPRLRVDGDRLILDD
jgi:E3 ubiquitin-protein ligase TRIP12